jgi:hypothetical protein
MQTRCWFQCFTGPKQIGTEQKGRISRPEEHAAGRRKKRLRTELGKKTPLEENRVPYRRPRRTSKTPLSPVDLEQREGRVHRYKGHAIRKNLAQHYRSAIVEGADPWAAMFRKARLNCPGVSEIEPFWVLKGNAFIERHVPATPASIDEVRLVRLKRAVSLYRLAFGQLRQADLVDFLGSQLGSQNVEGLSLTILLNLQPPAEGDPARVVNTPPTA